MKKIHLLGTGILVLGLVSSPVFGGTEGSNYTFYGLGAGGNSNGGGNVLIGGYTGNSLTSGQDNTFLGNYSGYSLTTGSNNTFVGAASGFYSTTGTQNVFIGERTGFSNTRGYSNTFVGERAGYANDNGNKNVFLGQEAGYYNKYGHYNAFLGFMAGQANIDGSYNTFLGYKSGLANTSGSENTCLGNYTGYRNTVGRYNTYLGARAGGANINGEGNVFLGFQAGYHETGSDKLYIANSDTTTPLVYGDFSKKTLTVNGNLDMIGTSGLLRVSSSTPDGSVKTGGLYSGNYCNDKLPVTLINGLSDSSRNVVMVGGGGSVGNSSTQIVFYTAENNNSINGLPRLTIKGNGNVGIGAGNPSFPLHMQSGAYVTTGGVWTNASSREYKDRIQSLGAREALAALQALNPVKYVYKADKTEKHVGFIAEDVPELLATKDRKGLSAMDIVAVLTKALQEQQKMTEEQQKINQEYKKAFEEQQRINQELLGKIDELGKKIKSTN